MPSYVTKRRRKALPGFPPGIIVVSSQTTTPGSGVGPPPSGGSGTPQAIPGFVGPLPIGLSEREAQDIVTIRGRNLPMDNTGITQVAAALGVPVKTTPAGSYLIVPDDDLIRATIMQGRPLNPLYSGPLGATPSVYWNTVGNGLIYDNIRSYSVNARSQQVPGTLYDHKVGTDISVPRAIYKILAAYGWFGS